MSPRRVLPTVFRRSTLPVLVAVAAVLLAGCATSARHSTSTSASTRATASARAELAAHHSTSTVVHTFRAYDASGQLTVPVAGNRKGSCFTTSLASPARWTFRCISGNQLLDPCFARPGTKSGTVACVADPWSEAVVVHLTRALPTHTYPGHRIWAVRLADGASCTAATGTVSRVAGVDLQYTCSDGTAAALQGAHTRHVHAVYARPTAHTLQRIAVRGVWHT